MSNLYAGVDLGGTSMIAIVADHRGKILGKSDCVTDRTLRPEALIDQIAEQVRAAAKDASVKLSKLEGAGIGAPGAVDPENGVVTRAPNLGWSDVPLARLLGKALDCHVVLGNDVQVAIVGEHAFGAAAGTERVVGVWVGTGIGGGLIHHGKLDRGARGAAGEIGHTVFGEDGPQCSCGRRGCVEALASRTAMERDVRAASSASKQESAALSIMRERNKPRMTSSVIARALKEGDSIMTEVMTRAQQALGLLVGNLVNVLDPEMVVIGGGIAQRLEEEFVAPIREVARGRFLRPDEDGAVRITHATLGDYSGALGACALARDAS
ncbi:MAG TPA: ROK family protein [Thermoanaerobaculia bacterium]|nr:ROK family protein [Thermoanaerobaculia bacterium]